MTSPKSNILIVLTFSVFLTTSCYRMAPPTITSLSEVQKKFIKTCKDEYGLDIVLHPLDNTIWIYHAMKEPFFEIKVDEQPAKKDEKPLKVRNLNFIDARYVDGKFIIEYDITAATKYPSDLGYRSAYSDKYQEKRRGVMHAIPWIFAELEEVPGDRDFLGGDKDFKRDRLVEANIRKIKPPDFFIIVISDIMTGIETRTTAYYKDMRRGMTDFSFVEEYGKRVVVSDPHGDPEIIGDAQGEYLEIKELTWPEFLSGQILYRIKFKYRQSDFPPKADDLNEILRLVYQTISGYSFKVFDAVELVDLAAGKTYLIKKEQLKEYE